MQDPRNFYAYYYLTFVDALEILEKCVFLMDKQEKFLKNIFLKLKNGYQKHISILTLLSLNFIIGLINLFIFSKKMLIYL